MLTTTLFFNESFIYEYKNIGLQIYFNIWTIEKLGYENIRIIVNFLRIHSNILLCERVQSLQQALLFGITQQPHQINLQVAIIKLIYQNSFNEAKPCSGFEPRGSLN